MTEHGPGEHDAGGDAPTPPKPRKRKGKKGRPPRKRAPRPTDAEVQRRTLEVMELLVKGYRRRHILQHVAENAKGWGRTVPPRTIDFYIGKAMAELTKIADEQRNVAKSKARARYEMTIRHASKAEQWEIVRKANRDLARLDGLEPGLRVQHTGSIETPVSGTVEHVHEHHVSGSIEERATRVSNLLGLATQRRTAAQSAAGDN